jgi:hypothetical protein
MNKYEDFDLVSSDLGSFWSFESISRENYDNNDDGDNV